jgi:NCS1 family nucleobase:cation symporter-1
MHSTTCTLRLHEFLLHSTTNTMGRLEVRMKKQQLAAAFKSKEAFVEFARAPQGKEGQTVIGDARWSNKDLEPTPENDRTWTW